MGSSDQLMSMCGMAALGAEDETRLAADCSMERSAISLLDRSLVMVLVVVALVVLV